MADTTSTEHTPALTQLYQQGSVPNVTNIETARRHRVTAMEDTKRTFPQLYLAVHVVGPMWEEAQFAQLFSRAGCYRAENVEKADLVIFTGGADVDPRLYGQSPHPQTNFIAQRDSADIAVYMKCLDLGIPMFGVCRGAQFLHVMNGGKLYQDVDNHHGAHAMWDQVKSVYIQSVSSVHHQMVIENSDMKVIAYTRGQSKKRWLNAQDHEEGQIQDIEAFFYRETCSFGVQGHPEYKGYPAYSMWCLEAIEDYTTSNPDLAWVDKVLRIKPELLLERQKKVAEESVEATRVTRRRKAK